MEKAKYIQPINKLGFKLGPIRVGIVKSNVLNPGREIHVLHTGKTSLSVAVLILAATGTGDSQSALLLNRFSSWMGSINSTLSGNH
jgi:hypothetical protein